MGLIKEHIETHLNRFIDEQELDTFLLENIENYERKKRYLKLLKYIDKLLDFKSDIFLNSLHIHLENDFDQEMETIIFQMIVAKSFYYQKSFEEKNLNKVDNNTDLEDLINKLQQRYTSLDGRCPDGASARNGGNRAYKNWVLQKRELRCLLSFYKSLQPNSAFINKTLINCKVGFKNKVLESYLLNPLMVDIDNSDFKFCYNIINSNLSLNDIDKKWDFIESTTNIILFDCESKRIMLNYSFEELCKWNENYGTNFKNYFIITFGNGTNSITKTKDKIQVIQERFKIKNSNSYTILVSELNYFLKKKTNKVILDFIGLESSIFWNEFILEAKITGLYELRSIKLMNIYSICLNEEIKNYILNDLFSNEEKSELLSYNNNTKQAILQLRDEDIENLKQTLSQTLDLVIKSDIKTKIIETLTNYTSIVLDEAILKNQNLLSKIRICLGLANNTKFKSWSDLINSDFKELLILSYRDQGRYPNYYFPSLLELDLNSECIAKSILPSFLFKQYYNWSQYNLNKDYYKLLNHPIREQYFEWNKLKSKIQELKPEQKLYIDWNLENEYSNSDHRDSYKLKLKGQRIRTVYSSDLFIVTDNTKTHYKVVKTDYLLSLETEESNVFIQNLDEIQENINIYDKIVDKKQQEAELEVIRKQFNLGDETAGRLWKVLLKNLAEVQGENELYSELKKYFETKGIKIVSQFHFKNSWINPQSESIAPLSKRVFIELCEYLKIPKIYFIIIQRIRNASKQSSRQSTRQMNQLLKDLFNDCCFDTDRNPNEIINNRLDYYRANHPLDDLGIDENHLATNLVALVELIQPELKLFELETIEKINYE